MTLQKISGIYKIENTSNGKRYIGSAINIGKRWSKHLSELHNNKHINRHLQSAWNKHGAGAFIFEVLEIVADAEMLTAREQHYFDNLSHEYNICPTAGSMFGYKHTAEARAKNSVAATGRVMSPEAIAKISASKIGIKQSPETIAKRSAAAIGRVMSPEAIAKTVACVSKPVLQYTKSMKLVAEYSSGFAAMEATGIQNKNISSCCLGKRKSAGGFLWKHAISQA